ncbi:hypothetical protein C7959_1171, partial [Orenia marismortui]
WNGATIKESRIRENRTYGLKRGPSREAGPTLFELEYLFLKVIFRITGGNYGTKS